MLYLGGIVLGDEAMPQFYRKIALNGRLSCDTEPYLHKRSDAEPEKSGVDGLTLQLRHDTTDVYVPILRSDFALQVRRSNVGAVWSNGQGLPSSKRPDLPFGNCWFSGIAANVHIIDRGPELPVHVLLVDEQGTLHRFIEFFEDGRHAGFYPLPGCHHLQDGRAMTLIRQGNSFEFKRKYGTTLSFDFEAPLVESVSGSNGSNQEEHRYYRAIKVNDRLGGYMHYHFEEGNRSLVPNAILFGKQGITIHRNPQGVVEKIIDTRGHEHRYEYRPSRFPDGSPLLVQSFRPVLEDGAPCTSYEYEETSQETGSKVDERHVALSSIADPLGNSYTFKYRHHFEALHTNELMLQAVQQPQPIRVSEVGMPDKRSVARFYDYSPSSIPSPAAPRVTFVSDAERNGLLLEFEEPQEVVLKDLPWSRTDGKSANGDQAPHLAVWRRLHVSYFQGSRHHFEEKKGQFRPSLFTKRLLKEEYVFDVGAGMALSKAIDTEGNVTSFAYNQKLNRPHLANALPKQFLDPLVERCLDVTESTNPLGGTKRFAYDSTTHAVVRKEDEIGHVTVIDVSVGTGLPEVETVYATHESEKAEVPFAQTEYEYSDPNFPGFLTRKVIRKISSPAEIPPWEVDLVREYEADEWGRLAREIADPEGEHFEWIFAYDEAANKISAQHPDGSIYQFRYDPLNRLVRVYQPNGTVKRFRQDARGSKIEEIEPNGDSTKLEYDSFARLIRKETETGPVDQRRKSITAFRYNAINSKVYEEVPGKPPKHYKWDGVQRVTYIKEGRQYPSTYGYAANGSSNLFRSSRFCPTFTLAGQRSRWYCEYDGLQNNLKKGLGLFRFMAFFTWNKTLVVQAFDTAGNLIERRDREGIKRYEYDALNRLVVEHYGQSSWKRTLRTSTGLEYGSVDSSGKRFVNEFNSAGHEI